MNEQMKVIIVYDGSPQADAPINDLRCAGIPPGAKALIVAGVYPPPLKPAVSELDLFSPRPLMAANQRLAKRRRN